MAGIEARLAYTQWAAPEHWKAEVFSVIRGLATGGKITGKLAVSTLARIPHLEVGAEVAHDAKPRLLTAVHERWQRSIPPA